MGRRACLVDKSPILLSSLPPMPSPVGGLIELLSSTHGHGAMPIGLRIVRPLVICGAIVAAAPGHVAGAKLCMVSLSHPFPSLPPFAEDKQGGRASSPAGGRGDRVCSHYSKRGVSQSTGDNLSRLPPRRRCKEQEKVRKEGRKEGRKKAKGALSV